MSGDFSRRTFDPTKHYSAVLMQQGRVQVDADFSEAQEIHRYRDETEATDVVGPRGVPRVSPGFAVQPSSGGTDLLISQGHLYVDGLLCENEQDDLAITDQPDLPGFTLPTSAGRYLVYLDAWQRHISAIEDPAIRETALGGPDTATRSRTVWQVRLIDATGATCATFDPPWQPPGTSRTGRLTASLAIPSSGSGPCILPSSAGFRGLENQLYRVEVQRGGTKGGGGTQPTVKWSRDNGSVVTAIVIPEGETLTGVRLPVRNSRLDDVLGFAIGDWVEIIDDRMELADQHGVLAQVDDVAHATSEIVIKPPASPLSLEPQFHPKVRRWDNRGTEATADGIAMPAGTATLALEDGLEVAFSDGDYQSGDYWLIPARTAISDETGTIEWPRNGSGAFTSKAPDGIVHHYAPLAIVQRSATGVYTVVTDGDCRRVFPPLTGVTAADVRFDDTACQLGGATTVQVALDKLCARGGGGCGITLAPGAGWEAALQGIGDDEDIDICFPAGDYPVTQTVVLAGKGHLKLSGAGVGARVVAAGLEMALRFERCASVVVRDLYVEAGVADSSSAQRKDLNGALSFVDCGEVELENVHARCAGGSVRAAACVTALSSRTATDRGGDLSVVRVRGCNLTPGFMQVGLLLVNAGRSTVEDNLIQVAPGAPPNIDALLQDPRYRAGLRDLMIAEAVLGVTAPAPGRNVTIDLSGQRVRFQTFNQLVPSWQPLIVKYPPTTPITSSVALLRHLERVADLAIRDRGVLPETNVLELWLRGILESTASFASQGIVVGGQVAREARILNNTVKGVIQGIHVGVSHREASEGPADRAGRVTIVDNAIDVVLPVTHARERHGIFAGNCDSLLIADNLLSLTRVGVGRTRRVEGIRVWGVLGRMMIVRQNHITGFSVGVRVNPLNFSPTKSQWLVADNVAPGSQAAVELTPPPAGTIGVRAVENYA
jgi:hypothetical protein